MFRIISTKVRVVVDEILQVEPAMMPHDQGKRSEDRVPTGALANREDGPSTSGRSSIEIEASQTQHPRLAVVSSC